MNNQKYKVLAATTIASIVMSINNVSYAQTDYATTTANLNMRKGPGTSHSIITTIKKGQKVEVIAIGEKWAKIKYKNTIGYSSKDYLKMMSSSGGSSNTQKSGTVTATTLNVRSGPSTSYKVITQVKKGNKVTILESKSGWYKVKLSNGKTGWVSDDYIKVTSTTNPTPEPDKPEPEVPQNAKTGTVTASKLNIRSGPSTSYKVITQASKGNKVTILESKSGWYKVKLSNGKTGWASDDYIKVTSTTNPTPEPDKPEPEVPQDAKTGTVTATTLNVRSGPSTSYKVITQVKKGNKVTILESKSGWYKVKLSNGKTGWVSDDYIKVTSTTNPTPTPDPEDEVIDTGIVTASALNIRKGPSTSYDVVTKAYRGDKVDILEKKNGWYKIKLSNKKIGWASDDYIDTTIDSLPDPDTGQKPLPTPPLTPSYVDAPINTKVMSSSQDMYQDMIVVDSTQSSGKLKSISVESSDNSFNVNYSIYSNGKWTSSSNGKTLSSSSDIEGVKMTLSGQPSNHHIFYRTKIKNQGWQNWVANGDISGEILVDKEIEDIEVRMIKTTSPGSMVMPKIAIDLGHNVERPKGSVNGIYNENYLVNQVGARLIYNLRSAGYNVIETKPYGRHTQSQELILRARNANENEADRFVSLHFNAVIGSANGTEVFYSSESGSKTMAVNMANNITGEFGFRNRGAKEGDKYAVLNRTDMPGVLVEGCFIHETDMNKFIAKGSQAYDIMAQAIIDGIY